MKGILLARPTAPPLLLHGSSPVCSQGHSTGLHRKACPVQAKDGSFPHHSGSSRKGSAREGLRQGLLLISSCSYSPWSLGVTVTSGRFTSFHTVLSLKLSDTRISGEASPSALLQNCSPNSGPMPSSAWISRAQVHPAARNPWTGFILSLSPRVRLCSLGHLYQTLIHVFIHLLCTKHPTLW